MFHQVSCHFSHSDGQRTGFRLAQIRVLGADSGVPSGLSSVGGVGDSDDHQIWTLFPSRHRDARALTHF